MSDLVVLVADKQMEAAVRGILSRNPLALAVSTFKVETILVHPKRDPGCRTDAASLLRSYQDVVTHALVVLDYEGSGAGKTPVEEMETDVERDLLRSGWGERTCCIAIDPELEAWVWVDSPEVGNALRWNRPESVQDWLQDHGYWEEDAPKPIDPKRAMERVLEEQKEPRSSSIYREIADTVSLQNCEDRAFQKLLATLREWFPPDWER